MLHFIPAWYQKNEWSENEQNWYIRRMHTEFDDTVKQIQLFHRSGAYPYQIMLLSLAPNFRHFIHRQSVYHAPYWSCFDAIQEVKRKKAVLLSFHDLAWPAHTEFIYTPFVLLAMLHGEKYAQIEFGEDGNPIQIELFKNGRLCRRNLYDDRGFVSSTIVYEEEKPLYQDYLMEDGKRKLRCYKTDGHVEINPKYPEFFLQYGEKEQRRKFAKRHYQSLEKVICEVVSAYLELTDEKDIFCVAMHKQHAALLQEALKDRKMILSFFEKRYDITKQQNLTLEMIKNADYIITDSQENTDKVKEAAGQEVINITDITPYDSRVDFGISQQLSTQKILVPVDGMKVETFERLVRCFGKYLLTHKNIEIHIFTRGAEYAANKILQKTAECLKEAGLEERWALPEEENTGAENKVDNEEGSKRVPVCFFVEQCVDELEVSKCMHEQRLIVDMRNISELYLRIMAISVGIPQIVYKNTKYVEHGKNGFVLQNLKELPAVLDYYLGSLKNWNEAMVYSYELGKRYTTKVLVDQWKEVIESVG